MRLCFIIFFELLTIPLSAQNIVLNGKIQEAASQEAIPYASLRIEGYPYGSISNAEGRFSIAFPAGIIEKGAILKVSCLGYESKRLSLQGLGPAELVIELEEKTYSLETVTIYSTELDAREMLRQALQSVPLNYPQQDYQLQSFYRHYCREGGVYGRLIEATVEINDVGGHDRLYRNPEQKLEMRLTQLRRSFDFTRFSAFQHIPIALNRTLLADIVSYSSLISRHLHSPRFVFNYQDTTYFDGEVVYLVEAKGRAEGLRLEAQFYIQASDFAIVKVDHRYFSQSDRKTWRYQREDHFVADYQRYEGKYYLSYLLNEGQYREQQLDSLGNSRYSEDHYHHVEMMTQEIRTKNFATFRGKEPEEAEMTNVPYEAGFWQQYSVLAATPLEDRIGADLASRMPLSQQFAGKKLPAGLQDQLASQYFAQWLERQSGRIVIVGFWNSQYDPSIKELLKARRLMKQFQELPFSLLLISTDTEDATWQNAIRKKRLYNIDHLRVGHGLASRLCKELEVSAEPYFIMYGPSGERLLSGSALPRPDQIKLYLSND
ncbi:MAG: carboxypeptidase-like regulatory domain-containing protein [Bacteroidia bacterium]